jgi:hypothetical protein
MKIKQQKKSQTWIDCKGNEPIAYFAAQNPGVADFIFAAFSDESSLNQN